VEAASLVLLMQRLALARPSAILHWIFFSPRPCLLSIKGTGDPKPQLFALVSLPWFGSMAALSSGVFSPIGQRRTATFIYPLESLRKMISEKKKNKKL
jgi:hypothetical protein